ncbi:MAG: hypothetical protein C5B53_13200 [Candidatus Melainabacteria bacterium]|nr:MAG: hypothetical protein C5B53_13200 [Candidatus Melainabacteria bacterium]
MSDYAARLKKLKASQNLFTVFAVPGGASSDPENHPPSEVQKPQKASDPLFTVFAVPKEACFSAEKGAPDEVQKLQKGFNLGECGSWLDAVTSWEPPSSDMAAVKEAALQFLSSEWAERAVSLGWGEVDLFGLFPNARAARFRYGAWGLVSHLGLSVHKPQLILISEDSATVRTVGGATHTKPRILPEAEISRPFWECRHG